MRIKSTFKHYRKCNYELWSVAKKILGEDTNINYDSYRRNYRLYECIIPNWHDVERLGFENAYPSAGECLAITEYYLNGKQIADDNKAMWKEYVNDCEYRGTKPSYEDFMRCIREEGAYGFLVNKTALEDTNYFLYYIGE